MTAFALIRPNTVIVAHSKCGSQSVKSLDLDWNITSKRIDRLREIPVVHLVLRHPLERLFSAYRMFYVRPVLWYRRGDKPTLDIPKWQAPITENFLHRYADRIVDDPVATWCRWLRSRHLQQLLHIQEPHVSGYTGFYRACKMSAPDAVYETNLTHLFLRYRLPVIQKHVGVWPWPARTLDDFLTAAGTVPHLDEDFELWNAHK
jgi:hypothetical protein